jgi:probable rRNA maturation factor
LRVHLKRQVKAPTVDGRGIQRFAKSVLAGEGIADVGVTVVLTDDAGIRSLNARFRNRDAATDVLAFPLHEDGDLEPDPGEAEAYLGDVVISLERAYAQAPRFHNDPEGELARLITHGLLHLLGYDHHSPADGRRMKAAERRALMGWEPGSLIPRRGTEA